MPGWAAPGAVTLGIGSACALAACSSSRPAARTLAGLTPAASRYAGVSSSLYESARISQALPDRVSVTTWSTPEASTLLPPFGACQRAVVMT